MNAEFEVAGWFWTKVLNLFGFAAITTPWRTIYILPEWFDHEGLRHHELVHIEQIDRDGPLKFWPKIVYDYFRHGHYSSPYEIEARERSGF
jgi:hypothetical protein